VFRAQDARQRGLSEAFARDGVVLIDRLFGPRLIAQIRQNVDRYIRYRIPRCDPSTVRREPGGGLRSIYFMDQHDPFFRRLGERDDLKALVRRVAGWEPTLYYVETFHKPARIGTKITAHQEIAFLPLDPPDMLHVWIALDPATDDNGSIRYWLGTHRLGLMSHRERSPGGQLTLGDEVLSSLGDVDELAVLPRGGAAIHGALIVHQSEANLTADDRLGLVVAYRGRHTQPAKVARGFHAPRAARRR
jgi:phytanoyl-CoA hydroxylase